MTAPLPRVVWQGVVENRGTVSKRTVRIIATDGKVWPVVRAEEYCGPDALGQPAWRQSDVFAETLALRQALAEELALADIITKHIRARPRFGGDAETGKGEHK